MTKRLGKTAKFDLVSLIKIEKKNLSNYYYLIRVELKKCGFEFGTLFF
jgi:hypothetical protein